MPPFFVLVEVFDMSIRTTNQKENVAKNSVKQQVNRKKNPFLFILGAMPCFAKTDGVERRHFLSCSPASSRLRNIVRMSKMAVSPRLATLFLQTSRLNLSVNKDDLLSMADCKVQ